MASWKYAVTLTCTPERADYLAKRHTRDHMVLVPFAGAACMKDDSDSLSPHEPVPVFDHRRSERNPFGSAVTADANTHELCHRWNNYHELVELLRCLVADSTRHNGLDRDELVGHLESALDALGEERL